jgi:hypothetical protein
MINDVEIAVISFAWIQSLGSNDQVHRPEYNCQQEAVHCAMNRWREWGSDRRAETEA